MNEMIQSNVMSKTQLEKSTLITISYLFIDEFKLCVYSSARISFFPHNMKIDNSPNKNKTYRPEMMFINIFTLCYSFGMLKWGFKSQPNIHHSITNHWASTLFSSNQQIIVQLECRDLALLLVVVVLNVVHRTKEWDKSVEWRRNITNE